MNICLVSQEYPPETARGGIGSQTWNKARALVRRGHVVHVLTASANADTTTETQDEVIVHRIRSPGFCFPIYEPSTYWIGRTWLVLEELCKLMKSMTIDLIDLADYGAEGFAYQLDRTAWNWVPVVVQLHGPLAMFAERIGWPEKGGNFHRVGTMMEGTSIRCADALMACSANIADFTAEYYTIAREEIDVVHCGVDAEAFVPAPKFLRKGDSPRILFVGNVAANKGVDIVLKSALRLQDKYPNLRLSVLGRGDNDHFRSLVARENAESLVESVGFVEDRTLMPAYYRQADVFCSPASHEVGVANVYIEAMACGCPVVAAASGGAPEAVTDGVNGFLVPPRDVDATTAALDNILSNAALRRRLGREGRRRVDEWFSMDRYMERVLNVYDRAIVRSRGRLAQAS